MSELFDPRARSIILPVNVVGPRGSSELRCVLDTGSMYTVLPTRFLRQLGFDPSRPDGRANLRTASGVVPAPLFRVPGVAALGRVRADLLVAAHDLPLGAGANGLLGLDFFRGFILTIDFVRGRIALARRRWWRLWR